ncbi:MAG: HAMP domain-containing histidine kinase [Solirubrobacterales bacterium]|nr:HAMP domain-containing histidine kinase [Solirubrobacterales bacterium]MBV9166346.1 HAMP domain-containing histidine kinase [Solirubrobacterales bacterium]MBV9534946.1 HAMP domain-containing histidine kinase [Solirubrobacterales bacterium]
MRALPRFRAPGLRGRIVGLVLFTTVATLAVAAAALLGPLESSLKHAALKTLEQELHSYRAGAAFAKFDLSLALTAPSGPATTKAQRRLHRRGVAEQRQLDTPLAKIGSKVGAAEASLVYPSPYSSGVGLIATWPSDSGLSRDDPYNDVASAFNDHHVVYGFGTIDGDEYVQAALPFRAGGHPWVLAIRKPIDEIPAAVNAVARAFLTAALAGLALTLILGIPLSATLVYRLRRLRHAAVRLTQEGPGVEVPTDRARDEVGDLARTFATMQGQLRHQEEARRAFVATASHELRTPLTSLDGMLELLDDDLRSGETDLDEARALLVRARVQSRRLGRLAADLLDLSRLDAEIRLRSEPVELGELCRAVLAEFELPASERDTTPRLEISSEPVWALGDPGSVARIVRILLDNALRVSPAGTDIDVTIRGGSPVALSVSDRGPGIAAEDRAIIFRRFQRGRDTGGQAGFGLGLAIGRELAERMGGELSLDDDYGPGAKFTLNLPAARAPQAPPVPVA